MSEQSWRLLVDGAASGPWNMAVDEALLGAVAAGTAPCSLRFYRWSPPCLSLGYFQPFEIVDLDACTRLGVEVVRRPTGGRAILHDAELTYSIALPAQVLGNDAGILPSYHRISRGLQAGLASLGVMTAMADESGARRPGHEGPICFDRPSAHEILLGGRKLVGSAQMRRGGAILQHGSVLIDARMDRLVACLRNRPKESSAAMAALAVGLAEVGVASVKDLVAAISSGIAREFHAELVPGALADQERRDAALLEGKYRSPEWTHRPLLVGTGETTRTR